MLGATFAAYLLISFEFSFYLGSLYHFPLTVEEVGFIACAAQFAESLGSTLTCALEDRLPLPLVASVSLAVWASGALIIALLPCTFIPVLFARVLLGAGGAGAKHQLQLIAMAAAQQFNPPKWIVMLAGTTTQHHINFCAGVGSSTGFSLASVAVPTSSDSTAAPAPSPTLQRTSMPTLISSVGVHSAA